MARSPAPASPAFAPSPTGSWLDTTLHRLAVATFVVIATLSGTLLWMVSDFADKGQPPAQHSRASRVAPALALDPEPAADAHSNVPTPEGGGPASRKAPQSSIEPVWLSTNEPSDLRLPDIPRTEIVASLKPRAEAGDAQAAYLLALTLNDCVEAFKLSPESGLPADTPNLSWFDGTSRETVTHRLDLCEGIDASTLAMHVEWLRRAADAGQIDAMLLYGSIAAQDMSPSEMLRDPQAVIDLRARTMSYLEQAIRRGSHTALREAAHRHDTGIMTARDRVKALAYQLAYVELQPLNHTARVTRDRYATNLSDDEQRRAAAMSQQILKECCR